MNQLADSLLNIILGTILTFLLLLHVPKPEPVTPIL